MVLKLGAGQQGLQREIQRTDHVGDANGNEPAVPDGRVRTAAADDQAVRTALEFRRDLDGDELKTQFLQRARPAEEPGQGHEPRRRGQGFEDDLNPES